MGLDIAQDFDIAQNIGGERRFRPAQSMTALRPTVDIGHG
jgi:hypothetical protein